MTIQLPRGPGGRSWAQKRVQARQHLDGTWSVYEQNLCIGHHPAIPLRSPEKARIKDCGARLARATRSLEKYLLDPELEVQC